MATKILYVCQPCHENAPENCGHSRDDLRITQLAHGPAWLCRDCVENSERSDFADGTRPMWNDLSMPPEYSPMGDQLLAFHEAWVTYQVATATGDPKQARAARNNMIMIHQSIRNP